MRFEISEHVQDGDLAILKQGLAESYIARGGLSYAPRKLGIFLRDESGTLIAGLTGETIWSWLYVAFFWVAEPRRNQGVGGKMLDQAEHEAIARGCHSAYLFTQSYGAPGFYEKHGYRKFTQFDACPPGHHQLGFMKRLTP